MSRSRTEQLDTVAALAEPVRRRLYEFVAGEGVPVDRDTAASGVGIGRPLAAFHLDRLVGAGLLGVVFRRRSGRSGPGAGRPAKFYVRPTDADVVVQLPPRSYDVAAGILAQGVEHAPAGRAAVLEAAYARGVALGTGRGDLVATLEDAGYEPFAAPDATIRLRNCPFHALVADHRDLTCAMNLALLSGVADALGDGADRAQARPEDGLCCVAFSPRRGATAS